MNPITKAIKDIRARIPPQILQYVFQPKVYHWRTQPINLDEQIHNAIIRHRVLTDCDMVGGTEVTIPLEGIPSERVDELMTVYYVPKHKTQNRTITSVLSMSYINAAAASYLNSNQNYSQCSVSPVLIAGQAVMNAMSPSIVPSTARVQLVGENTVMVREVSLATGVGYLRCILANDENMSHIQIRSFLAFSKLCELAAKAYIYNEKIVEIDQGVVQGGAEIGKLREIIEGYADAEEMYQTYLSEKWQPIAFMNDRESWERFLKFQTGGYR